MLRPKPTRVCLEPDCPELTQHGAYCSRHERRDRSYNTRRWRRAAGSFLRRNPTCEWCTRRATHVDHRDGLGPAGPRGFDEANFRGLCDRCHGRHSARQAA